MRRQVERHIVEEHREIRAVIQIEPTQEILVRLPAAGMLGDDDAGDGFKDFAAAQNWAVFQLRLARRALRSRVGNSNQTVGAPRDHDLRQTDDLRG